MARLRIVTSPDSKPRSTGERLGRCSIMRLHSALSVSVPLKTPKSVPNLMFARRTTSPKRCVVSGKSATTKASRYDISERWNRW